jgi:2-alkyl-3-oxoalkanoate reductase
MKHVLVTGGSGFIGGALVRRLRRSDAGAQPLVSAPTRAEFNLFSNDHSKLFESPIDVLIHCAASRTRFDQSPSSWPEEVSINVNATARLYDAARRQGARAIIQLSSVSVFQAQPDLLGTICETSPMVIAPADAYALSKRWAEELAISLRSEFESVAIVRPGMTYGELQHDGVACARIANSVRAKAVQTIASPDGHRIAPVHVDDVVDVLARLALAPRSVEVNVAGPDAMFQRQFLTDLAEFIGSTLRLHVAPDQPATSYVPSTFLVDALFPERTRTPWRTGAARCFRRTP